MGQHIAFFNIPAHGHVNPTLAIVTELVRRGHRVTYAVTAAVADKVAAAGADVLVYEPTKMKIDPLHAIGDDQAYIAPFEESIAPLDFFTAHFDKDRPDLIAYDMLTKPPTSALAHRYGVPTIGMFPTFASNEQFSLLSAVSGKLGTDLAMLPASFRQRVARFLSEQGMAGISVDEFVSNVPEFGLVFLPKAFQLRAETFDDRYVFVGPCLGDRSFQGEWSPPGDGKPILLVSMGTMLDMEPAFFDSCVDAFAVLPWHVVMSVGHGFDEKQLDRPLPPNVEVHAQVPQLSVLRHADLMLCHSGMGGTMEALSFGVPVIAVPYTPEQDLVADQVVALKVGYQVAPAKATAKLLRDLVLKAAADDELAHQVKLFRDQIEAAGGAVRAADEIENYLAAWADENTA